jgi:hypothetical protein
MTLLMIAILAWMMTIDGMTMRVMAIDAWTMAIDRMIIRMKAILVWTMAMDGMIMPIMAIFVGMMAIDGMTTWIVIIFGRTAAVDGRITRMRIIKRMVVWNTRGTTFTPPPTRKASFENRTLPLFLHQDILHLKIVNGPRLQRVSEHWTAATTRTSVPPIHTKMIIIETTGRVADVTMIMAVQITMTRTA